MNILLTAAGAPAGICFARSLREIEDVRLVGTYAGDEADAALVHVMRGVPFAGDPEYIPALRHIVAEEKIDAVIPLVDEEIRILSERGTEIDCAILVSPASTIRYTSNKARAYEKLSTYLPQRFWKREIGAFPVFAKPHIGRGGKGSLVVMSRAELDPLSDETHVFQELLEGPEVSVDTFFDKSGALVVAIPRIRGAIDQGISLTGSVFASPELLQIIMEIARDLQFIGPVNFQFMRRGSEYRLTEINARGSGGLGITIRAGADMPKLAYKLLSGKDMGIPHVHTGSYRNFEEVVERQRRKKANENAA